MSGEQAPFQIDELLKEAINRPVTDLEMQHLLRRYAYLEIQDLARDPKKDSELVVRRADCGWRIWDCGQRLLATPGRLSFGGFFDKNKTDILEGDDAEDEGEEGKGRLVQPAGTLMGQGVMVTWQLMCMAIERGWVGINIAEGLPRMQRLMWSMAEEQGMKVLGFEPTDEDQLAHYEIQRTRKKMLELSEEEEILGEAPKMK